LGCDSAAAIIAPFNLRIRLTETAGSSTPQKSSLVDKSKAKAAYAGTGDVQLKPSLRLCSTVEM
jgi:hypothetical protein